MNNELQQLTGRVWFLPPDDAKDRPMIGYINGDLFSVGIDAGFSPAHVHLFYDALNRNRLTIPLFTILTHWHWDHTLGLPALTSFAAASKETNKLLSREKERLKNPAYEKELRSFYLQVDDEFQGSPIIIRTAEIEFDNRLVLHAGGVTAEAFHVDAPHTPDSTLIYVPEERTLFIGDANLSDFETGRTDPEKMKNLIHVIKETACDTLLLGHQGAITKDVFLNYYA